jgi:hypothetical protein
MSAIDRLRSIGHRIPAEVKDLKSYESARKHEKKMSMPIYRKELSKRSLNKSQSVDNISK